MWCLLSSKRRDFIIMNFNLSYVVLFIITTYLFISSSQADPLNKECGKLEHSCHCGTPPCIDLNLVNNGVKDCQDGSDEEGQWDPSQCKIKNKTSDDIRFKRAAISELYRVTNGGATTTFFEGERGRMRPTGILLSTAGNFQISGTTTEFITKLIGTSIKGTYARILSTSSRIFEGVTNELVVKPTGFIASTLSTEINGYATTVHTTEFYRTYVDDTYAQQTSSYSNVYYPPWYTEQISPTSTVSSESEVYPTASYETSEERSKESLISGSFVNKDPLPILAELGIVEEDEKSIEEPSQEVRSFRQKENELRVTGTHGNFIHTDSTSGEETTYNVFTGTYTQASKTFLFFFGNTVLSPTSPTSPNVQQTILVENGPQRHNVLVDMSQKLRLIVPGTKERTTINTSVDGVRMEGVMVEVEGSEFSPSDNDLILVGGANPTPTPTDPRIDSVTITLDKNIRAQKSSSSKSGPSYTKKVVGIESNELPTARKIPQYLKEESREVSNMYEINNMRVEALNNKYDDQNMRAEALVEEVKNIENSQGIRPTKTTMLPTYTVGNFEGGTGSSNYYEATTGSDEDLKESKNEETSTLSSSKKSTQKAPVFQRPPSSESKTKNNFMVGGRTQKGQPGSFSRAGKSYSESNEIPTGPSGDENDLQSAASNRHATVTYVGFADFTTTVGNTVIVFMPRTRMLEDLAVSPSKSSSFSPITVEPTRYTYLTTTEKEEKEERETTTEKEPIIEEIIEITTPKPPKTIKKKVEEIPQPSESETTVTLSGRATVFNSPEPSPTPTPVVKSSSSSTPSFTRSKFTPKAKKESLTTAVFQSDIIKPTGLVSSIGGSLVRDSTTTQFTSLVIGTFIDGSYAQVIKSTSRVYSSAENTPSFIYIQPTPAFTPPQISPTMSSEITTEKIEEDTTTVRAEVRVTSSTSSTTEKIEESEGETTTAESVTNIPEKKISENEVEVGRKVAGAAQEQLIVEKENIKKEEVTLERPSKVEKEKEEKSEVESEQTIYVTRTVPTTVFRTYTYFTTYFIPKQDTTISSIISREVTSTAVGFVQKTFSSVLPTVSASIEPSGGGVTEEEYEDEYEESDISPSQALKLFKTYFTTYTYLTTFFNGDTSSVSSREEVVSSVATITQTGGSSSSAKEIKPTTTPSLVSSSSLAEIETSKSSKTPKLLEVEVEGPKDEKLKNSVVEQTILNTFFTTYTYFSTLFDGLEASTRSRIEVITNVVPTTVRTTISPESSVEPTAVLGRKVAPSDATTFVEDQNEVGTHLNERSEPSVEGVTTVEPNDYYELESSEMTTERSAYNEHEELTEEIGEKHNSIVLPTPALKTLFTTFSFFTTYYKGSTSSIATRLQTVTNIVSDAESEGTASETVQIPVFPITYLTTDQSTIVTSREETISNVVTPGVDDLSPSTTSETIAPTSTAQRNAKELEVVPAEDEIEMELTTFFTTYTYFTSSYIGDETIVNSRFETVTNVVSNTPSPTSSSSIAPSASISPSEETDDYDLPTGLLSTIKSTEILDRTTVEYSTDVFGTYIDGIYAQVLESTSKIISPTLAQTIFMPEASETPTGLLTLNEGKTVEADGQRTTFYKTETFGTQLNGTYAHVLSSSSSVTGSNSDKIDGSKTGLVRVIDGSLFHDDKTTFYTSSILGTIIDGQYGQIIESTSRFVIAPTKSVEISTNPPSSVLESSEEITTEPPKEVEEIKETPRRFPGALGRGRSSSRLTFNPSTTKTLPLITPFASRSRPVFAPKRRQSSAVVVSRDEITPTVTATPAPRATSSFQNRQRGKSIEENPTPAPTPKLPTSSTRSRFSRPQSSEVASKIEPVQTTSRRFSVSPVRLSTSSIRPSSRFPTRPRGSILPSRVSSSPKPSVVSQEDKTEEEDEKIETEEEKEKDQPSTVKTTEAPKVSTRLTGNNRFRINPRLNVANLLSTTTTEKPTTTKGPRRTFGSRPAGRVPVATTTTEKSDSQSYEEEEEEEKEEVQISSTTTGKPSLKDLIATRRPSANLNRDRPTSRPAKITTSTTTPPPRTTTKRSFAPRSRPAGFPSRALVKTTELPQNDAPNSESGDELEIQETKNLASNVSMISYSNEEKGGDSEGAESQEVYSYENSLGSESGEHSRRVRQVTNYGSRQSTILRSNYRPSSSSNTNNRNTNTNTKSNSNFSPPDYDENDYYTYYDELPLSTSTTTTTTTTPKPSTRGRFRGRITPSSSPSKTPFTLTPKTTPAPRSRFTSKPARGQSRYRESYSSTTTAAPSRFRSRYRETPSTTPKSRRNFQTAIRNRAPIVYEEEREVEENVIKSILTVTHYIPSETTIPVIIGKSTEFKSLLIPSPSIEVLSPYQYTISEHMGKDVIFLTSSLTSTPSFGVTQVTRFIVKESPTTTVTFTPTTIRGRKTSFSHIIPSTVYIVEPLVSTLSPLTDQNQLTNLLLSQLLGNLNLNNLRNNYEVSSKETGTEPVTSYVTKTTTYVTTITDFTSTVIPITLHGKAIKTTIVESSVNVLTATEFITETNVITPTSTLSNGPSVVQGLNPNILQLLQQQINLQATPSPQLTISSKVEESGREKRTVPVEFPTFLEGEEKESEDYRGIELEDSVSLTEALPTLIYSSQHGGSTQTLESVLKI